MTVDRVFRWKRMLNKDIIQAVEYMCGNELKYVGNKLENNIKDISTDINEKIVKFLLKDLNSTIIGAIYW